MKSDFSKFQNCLRIQITPDEYADERIRRLVLHCKKYGFTNVMFLTTAEEFFLGHVSVEEITPWVEVVKTAAKELRKNGIGVGLHHWIGVGHIDRGIGLKENQSFTTMVDFNGKRSISVACPLDEEWQAHFERLLGFMIAEIKPDYYWVEDDFRLHNHAPLEWGGCFCEKHIARFNQALGTKYTRAEFCEKAFQKGEPTKERKAWLDSSRDTMLEFAALIYKIIKSANPSTDIALMTSFPEEHCLEARDWTKLFEIFSGGEDKLNRIHLPGYFEISGKDYMYAFNVASMTIRAFSPPDTKILPELENGSIAIFRKNARFLGFQLESAIPLCLSGMTYNIYDPVGNGPIEEYGFASEVQRLTPYMQAVMETGVKFSNLQGVVIPIDEKIVYEKKIRKNFYDLRTHLFNVGGYVSAMGLSYRYSKEKRFSGEMVFLFGDAVYIFTDEELRSLFADNFVVMDGGAVLLLKERGLLDLIGAKDALLYPAETGYQSYEQATDETEIFGVKGFRASCRVAAGDFVKIEYDENSCAKVLSHARKADGTIKWNAFVRGEKYLINPFVVDKKLYTQFSELRRYFVAGFVEEKANAIVDSRFEGVNPYLYRDERESIVMLVNGTLENFDKTEFFIKGVDFDEVVSVDKDGVQRSVAFEKQGGTVVVERPLAYMSTVTLRLIKR
jgi:hypothetical protein